MKIKKYAAQAINVDKKKEKETEDVPIWAKHPDSNLMRPKDSGTL